MSFITNIKDYYVENGFEVYPYSQEEVNNACDKLGELPELLKVYLLTIGRIEEESQFEKSILKLKNWSSEEETMLVFADYGPSCEYIEYGVKKSDLSNPNPSIYWRGDTTKDNEWEQWNFSPEEDCLFENLSDFFICAAKENTDISIEEYRANRRLWTKLGYVQE